jgi:Tyrosine-protein kinase ephrin type A/B receptor-like/Regulator of chromosome condensation (RCC1) repeat
MTGRPCACGLLETHTIKCWGLNYGLAPTPSWIINEVPTSSEHFLDISAGQTWYGEGFLCGLRPNGTISCFGALRNASLEGPGFITVDSGTSIVCGITRPSLDGSDIGGQIRCWSDFPLGSFSTIDNLLQGIPAGPFIDVSIGESHACALSCNGSLSCWGASSGYYNMAGAPKPNDPFATNNNSPSPVDNSPPVYTAVSCASSSTCAITNKGTLHVGGYGPLWNTNDWRALGASSSIAEISCGSLGVAAIATSEGANQGRGMRGNVLLLDPSMQRRIPRPSTTLQLMPRLKPSGNWYGVASSSNGLRLAAVENGGRIYTSSDGGETWNARDIARKWEIIVSNADGSVLLVVAGTDGVYVSRDAGVSFTRATLDYANWRVAAISASGRKMVVAMYGGYIYVSHDFGRSFVYSGSFSRVWGGLASSADGTRLAAVAEGEFVYTSIDGGLSWQARSSSGTRVWNSISSSADGMKLVAAEYQGAVWISENGGVSWTARGPEQDWVFSCQSADGQRIFLTTMSATLYASNDGGVSFEPRGKKSRWWPIACSADGRIALAGELSNGLLYLSKDGGDSFLPSGTALSISSVFITADGSRMIAAQAAGSLLKSENSDGTMWESLGALQHFVAIAGTSNGNYLFGSSASSLWVSMDKGFSFKALTGAPKLVYSWSALASSSNGGILFAAPSFGQPYRSLDGGATFSVLASASSSTGYFDISLSADGRIVAMAPEYGAFYLSSDRGTTALDCTSASTHRKWLSAAVSSSGNLIVFGAGGVYSDGSPKTDADGPVVVLTNLCNYPIRRTSFYGIWSAVAVNGDGSFIAAASISTINSPAVFISTDKGQNWISIDGLTRRSWKALAISADTQPPILVALAGKDEVLVSRVVCYRYYTIGSCEPSLGNKLRVPTGDGDAVLTPRIRSLGAGEEPSTVLLLSSSSSSLNATNATFLGLSQGVRSLTVSPLASFEPGALSPGGKCFSGLSSLTFLGQRWPDDPALLPSPQQTRLPLGSLSALDPSSLTAVVSSGAYIEEQGRFDLASLPPAGIGSSLSFLDLSNSGLANLTGKVLLEGEEEEVLPDLSQTTSTTSRRLRVDLSGNQLDDTKSFLPALKGLASELMTAESSSATSGAMMTLALSLAYNNISILPASSFASGFENLDELDLTHNGLTFISATAFDDISNSALRSLRLTTGNSLGERCKAGEYNALYTLRNKFGDAFPFPVCRRCSAGSYCSFGVSIPCAVGRYGNAEGAFSPTSCLACPSGSFNDLKGQTRLGCQLCSVGRASNLEGEASPSACGECLPGFYAASPGQAQCSKCSAGRFSSEKGATSSSACQPCPRGTYSASEGAHNSSVCQPCRDGFTTVIDGATRAEDCNLDMKRNCPSGHGFSSLIGACERCPPGYTGTTGELGCSPCRAGTYLPSGSTGKRSSDACLQCPRGRFSTVVGASNASVCLQCPFGLRSNALADACVGCPAGLLPSSQSWREDDYTSPSSGCVPCSNGTVCVTGVLAALPKASRLGSLSSSAIPLMRKAAISASSSSSASNSASRLLTSATTTATIPFALSVDPSQAETNNNNNKKKLDLSSTVVRLSAPAAIVRPVSPSVASFVQAPSALVVATLIAAIVPLLLFALPVVRHSLGRLRAFDAFSKDRPLRDGDVVQKFSSPLGVFVSGSYAFGAFGACVILILAWAGTNIAYSSALRPLLSDSPSLAAVNPLELTFVFATDNEQACADPVLPSAVTASSAGGATTVPLPQLSTFRLSVSSLTSLGLQVGEGSIGLSAPVLCGARVVWPALSATQSNLTVLFPPSAQSISWVATGLLTPSSAEVDLGASAAVSTGTIEPPASSFGIRSFQLRLSVLDLTEEDRVTPLTTHGMLIAGSSSSITLRDSPNLYLSAGSDAVTAEIDLEPLQQRLYISVVERSSFAQLLASAIGLVSGLGIVFRLVYVLLYTVARKLYRGHALPWEREAVARAQAREKALSELAARRPSRIVLMKEIKRVATSLRETSLGRLRTLSGGSAGAVVPVSTTAGGPTVTEPMGSTSSSASAAAPSATATVTKAAGFNSGDLTVRNPLSVAAAAKRYYIDAPGPAQEGNNIATSTATSTFNSGGIFSSRALPLSSSSAAASGFIIPSSDCDSASDTTFVSSPLHQHHHFASSSSGASEGGSAASADRATFSPTRAQR